MLSLFRKLRKRKKKCPLQESGQDKEDIIFKRTLHRGRFGNLTCEGEKVDHDDYDHFYEIASKFDTNELKVVKVEYIVNSKLHLKYENQKELFRRANVPIVENFVFHGTLKTNIDSIIEDGFKIGGVNGHAVINGAVYGAGIYTSISAHAPLQFSAHSTCMIALRALPGLQDVHCVLPAAQPDWLVLKTADQTLPCYIIHFIKSTLYKPIHRISPPPVQSVQKKVKDDN